MKLEGKVTERRLKQVNPEILTSILLVSATILALIMSNIIMYLMILKYLVNLIYIY